MVGRFQFKMCSHYILLTAIKFVQVSNKIGSKSASSSCKVTEQCVVVGTQTNLFLPLGIFTEVCFNSIKMCAYGCVYVCLCPS